MDRVCAGEHYTEEGSISGMAVICSSKDLQLKLSGCFKQVVPFTINSNLYSVELSNTWQTLPRGLKDYTKI